ncbi:MAG TPA: DUF6272 family protein [Flavobacteriales bacterium]
METRFGHSLFQALRHDVCSFGYSGGFRDEHTARLIDLGGAALDIQGVEGAARGKLAFIMVEAYQNIIRHRAEPDPPMSMGEGRSLFVLRCEEKGQHVVAVNPVRKAVVPGISELLLRLEGLDRERLKELFLTGLQRAGDPERRGAGLGLIEMARRSGGSLGHLLRDLDPEHALFVLAIRLGEASAYGTLIKEAATLHADVVANDVRFFHVGIRSAAVGEAILRLMEEERSATRNETSAVRGALAAMDAVNVPDAERQRGVFLLAGPPERSIILAGSVFSAQQASEFEREVARMGGWSRQERERHYRDSLLGRGADEVRLGLIELARNSAEPIEQLSVPVDGGVLVLVRTIV